MTLQPIAQARSIAAPKPGTQVKGFPQVVFDMSFRWKGDKTAPIVSGAALAISAKIAAAKSAEMFFLERPLSDGGEVKVDPARPLIFALTLYGDLWDETVKEVQMIKAKYPQARIMLGGPEVTDWTRKLSRLKHYFPAVDAFVRGDGEMIINQLVRILSKDQISLAAASKLHGCYVDIGGMAYSNEEPNFMTQRQYSTLPSFAVLPSLVDDINRLGSLQLNTSLGCKYRCIFCSITKHPPVRWTAERLVRELHRIRGLIADGVLPEQAKNIDFQDNDFFQDRERAKHFLRLVAADPKLRKFFTFTYQSTVSSFFVGGKFDVELLGLLKKVRPAEISFGSDGYHPNALKFFRKAHSLPQAEELIQRLSRNHIKQVHYVILTYPEIKRDELIETIKRICMLFLCNPMCMFTIKILLQADEGNRLLEYFYKKFPEKRSADPEKTKVLPFAVCLNDRALHMELYAASRWPLPNRERMDALMLKIKPGQVPEKLFKFLYAEFESCGWNGTIMDLLESSRMVAIWVGLELLLDQFGAPNGVTSVDGTDFLDRIIKRHCS